ncbi:TPA: hypothetical protein VLK50_000593 [Streptococcus pyogenes]|uniref:hypothetical protein n=1 Tax=Streptococcus equi TaxID=1336 RepID=UPI001E4E8C87|nr:hypothetical protein [Streptococcus equi]HEQ2065279.1 hypothetical protein [Streptococcus pyogenes]MCD3382395.1 hypothetical protein [Streptococcus equi subsp. zooepidemicus]HEL0799013.1 hypothetical protein [Streptococcus equi subsp. zooepidemicus]HEQ2283275.1 hypothetical protein [Streptococcus pyogenes]HEQ2292842.1 hypothetical protein [Streptococcus pyogenes]
MAESFDYVAFARDFEKRHGRPPTAEELEQGIDPWEGIVTFHTPEETQAEIERINASYKPSLWERLKTGLSFVTRNFFRALLILIQTPVYLTLFFFNLIKSTIGVFVIWFVSKFMFILIIGTISDIRGESEITGISKSIMDCFLGSDFIPKGNPNFFPHPVIDAWIIGIIIVFLALVMTFSKTEA